MRVLVVEDQPKMARLLCRGLESEGLAADHTDNGEDAVWMAGSTAYDAIVLDVMLPGIDGFETCARMRASDVWAPVLMLTARDAVLVHAAGRTLTVEVGAVGRHRLDPLRIDQAMANLTENALTHGRGDVTLGARATEQALELFVRDQGPGFPADFRRHAFERFSRADPGRTDAGAGLGLAIVQANAVAHGGRVAIGQAVSGDTEVSLFLPGGIGIARR